MSVESVSNLKKSLIQYSVNFTLKRGKPMVKCIKRVRLMHCVLLYKVKDEKYSRFWYNRGFPNLIMSNVFAAQCVVLKKEGLAQVNHHHHPALSDDDLKNCMNRDVFSLNRPLSLQRKVFFDIMLYLLSKGKGNFTSIHKYYHLCRPVKEMYLLSNHASVHLIYPNRQNFVRYC